MPYAARISQNNNECATVCHWISSPLLSSRFFNISNRSSEAHKTSRFFPYNIRCVLLVFFPVHSTDNDAHMLAYKIFACYYFSRLLNRAVMHMCFKFYSINLEDYIYMLVDCFFGIPHTGLEGISVREPRRLKSNTTCMTPEVVDWLVHWAIGTLLSITAVQPRHRRNTIHHRYAHIMVQWNRSTVVRLLSCIRVVHVG